MGFRHKPSSTACSAQRCASGSLPESINVPMISDQDLLNWFWIASSMNCPLLFCHRKPMAEYQSRVGAEREIVAEQRTRKAPSGDHCGNPGAMRDFLLYLAPDCPG